MPNLAAADAAAGLSPIPNRPIFSTLERNWLRLAHPVLLRFTRHDGNYWQDCNKSPRCMKLN